jgi:hypothetical protein
MPELQVQKKTKNKEKRVKERKEIREEKQESNLIKIAFSLLIKSVLLLCSSRLKSFSLIRLSLCLQFYSSSSSFWPFKRPK